MRGIVFLMVWLWAGLCAAEPVHYALDPEGSAFAFTYTLLGRDFRGQMPVASADLMLDLDRAERSSVRVTLDVTRAEAGFAPATAALKGPDILDAAHFPTIGFESTRIAGELSRGVQIAGRATLRGVTRPITLAGTIYRRAGTPVGDLSHLTVTLKGRLSRSAFGASGYPGLVDDTIGLDITARLHRLP